MKNYIISSDRLLMILMTRYQIQTGPNETQRNATIENNLVSMNSGVTQLLRSFILLLIPTAPRYTRYLRTPQDKCIPRECRLTTPDVPVKSNIATMLAARKCFYRGKFVSLSSKKRQRNLHANPLLATRYQVRSLSKQNAAKQRRIINC